MEANQKVITFAGPSGSGKDSIIEGVLKNCSSCVRLTTATTRAMRPGEVHGEDYYFLSKEEFLAGIHDGEIPEHWHAVETDRYYGTYLPDLRKKLDDGKTVLAQIQNEGVRFLKKEFGAFAIAVEPGSLEELRTRIKSRHSMDEAEVEERMRKAVIEMKENAEAADFVVKNKQGKLDEAITETLDILREKGYL